MNESKDMLYIFGEPAAIVPGKDGRFEYTTLIYPDGTRRREPLQLRTVMNRLAKERAIDLRLIRKGRKCVILNLRDGYVLMPVRVRTERPIYGYVDVKEIALVVWKPGGTYAVRLKSGTEIPVIWRLAYFTDIYAEAVQINGKLKMENGK